MSSSLPPSPPTSSPSGPPSGPPAHSAPPLPDATNQRWETVIATLAGLSCVSILFSIAVSQILLGAAVLSLLIARRPLQIPARLGIPLAGFLLWSVLSILFSIDSAAGLPHLKKLYVFLAVLVGMNAFSRPLHVRRAVQGIITGGAVAAIVGLGQFIYDLYMYSEAGLPFYENYITHQITGFMSHWMTYSGQLLQVSLLLLAFLLFHQRLIRRAWGWPALGLIGLALLAAFTRGAWLGTLAGITLLLFFYRKWTALLVPALVLAAYLLAPASVQRRADSIAHPEQDSSAASRIVMARTGIRMIRAHPLFGVGPERIGPEFHNYVPAGAVLPPAWYGHLHNTFLQIGAERGLPCLLFFLWFLFAILREHMTLRSDTDPFVSTLGYGVVAITVGMMVLGLFEFNFGDSEVLTLYLFVVSFSSGLARMAGTGTPCSPAFSPAFSSGLSSGGRSAGRSAIHI